MRELVRVRRPLAVAVVWGAVVVTGAAQTAPPPAPLPLALEAALVRAAEHNPEVQVARAREQVSRGGVIEAAAPFDWQPRTFVLSGRDSLASTRTNAALPSLNLRSGVGVDRTFRSGVSVASSLSFVRSGPGSWDSATSNVGQFDLGLVLPLMEGRGGGLLTAREEEASAADEAAGLDVQQEAADTVLRTTVAYWRYRAAERRLDIQRESERRAERMLEETQVLVAADERPRSDLDAMRASRASRRASRVLAEQQVRETWRTLALEMALEPAALMSPPATATAFPSAPASASTAAAAVDTLVRQALGARADLMASSRRAGGSRILRDGALQLLMPRFDFHINATYAGLATGGQVAQYFAPFFHYAGSMLSFQFTYRPAMPSQSRGTVIRTEMAAEQAAIRVDQLTRQIGMDVATAWDGLAASRSVLGSGREAVEQSQLVLETERQKFQLGISTMFDFINAEEKLTAALLTELTAEAAHAEAIARLQHARGVLVRRAGPQLVPDVGQLLAVDLPGTSIVSPDTATGRTR